MRYAMAIDTKKCVGCSDCVVACQTENNVPIGYCRDWVVEVTRWHLSPAGDRNPVGTLQPLRQFTLCEMLSNRCQSLCRWRNCPGYTTISASDAEPVLLPVPMMPAIHILKGMWINVPSAFTGSKRDWNRPVLLPVRPNACISETWKIQRVRFLKS